MKKMLAVVGLFMALAFVGKPSFAGTVILDNGQQAPVQINTSIVGSSATAGGSGGVFVALAPGTNSFQSAAQNCFTRLMFQLSNFATGYVLDNGTTVQVVYGQGLGSASGTQLLNSINLVDEHLSPLCLTAGKTTNLQILDSAYPKSDVVNYVGFTR